MKLYTEEQVRQIASTICLGRFDFNDTPDDLVNELIPIELPSDEEIEKEINLDVYIQNDIDFYNGAKWVIEQIKQQDK
jgi:hypothetical protein